MSRHCNLYRDSKREESLEKQQKICRDISTNVATIIQNECQAEMSRQSQDIFEDHPITHCVPKNLFMSRKLFLGSTVSHQEDIVTTNIEDISSEDNVSTINIMSRQCKFSFKGKALMECRNNLTTILETHMRCNIVATF